MRGIAAFHLCFSTLNPLENIHCREREGSFLRRKRAMMMLLENCIVFCRESYKCAFFLLLHTLLSFAVVILTSPQSHSISQSIIK